MAPRNRPKYSINGGLSTRRPNDSKIPGRSSVSKVRRSVRQATSERAGSVGPNILQVIEMEELGVVSHPNAGLCFREAIDALEGGMITKEEYFRHLITHYSGLRHPFDLKEDAIHQLMITEKVANSIRKYSLQSGYEVFTEQELDACHRLMMFCTEDDLGNFITTFDELSSRSSLLLHPMTTLAAMEGSDKIFRFCVPHAIEAKMDIYIAIQEIIYSHPEILDFLLEHNWQNIQNSPKALQKGGFLTKSLLPGPGRRLEVLKWILDHGARIPQEEYKMMAMDPPQPKVLRFLLELNPKGILRFGMLQHAAGQGNIAILEKLIEAGANVNQDPPDLGDIREPGPYKALWMAINAEHGQIMDKHINAARLLLKNGADMNLPAGNGRREETAFQAA
ncbi:hypothetical protein EJ08DRAFT_696304 [Tothia fuscella]|uniref:Ankyrin repeat protein n=1 Tax=Tothia fuscella TaxID=1048955 RepID=A0A9P4TYJ9_9PEZI|nr:hypothetical protein EJ08DRAFT_696304 [Tothia fuscella]